MLNHFELILSTTILTNESYKPIQGTNRRSVDRAIIKQFERYRIPTRRAEEKTNRKSLATSFLGCWRFSIYSMTSLLQSILWAYSFIYALESNFDKVYGINAVTRFVRRVAWMNPTNPFASPSCPRNNPVYASPSLLDCVVTVCLRTN